MFLCESESPTLFGQSNDLWHEIDFQFEDVALACLSGPNPFDAKYTPRGPQLLLLYLLTTSHQTMNTIHHRCESVRNLKEGCVALS